MTVEQTWEIGSTVKTLAINISLTIHNLLLNDRACAFRYTQLFSFFALFNDVLLTAWPGNEHRDKAEYRPVPLQYQNARKM